MSQPPQVLDDETMERLLGAVDRSTATGKRDYAALILAAQYGMRPGDIRGLQLASFDWRGQRIVFVQSKSQRPLELPLLADVDHALVDSIVICTDSRDKYGRYLTDLFYLPGSTDPAEVLYDGFCLNRQLLDEGLARPY